MHAAVIDLQVNEDPLIHHYQYDFITNPVWPENPQTDPTIENIFRGMSEPGFPWINSGTTITPNTSNPYAIGSYYQEPETPSRPPQVQPTHPLKVPITPSTPSPTPASHCLSAFPYPSAKPPQEHKISPRYHSLSSAPEKPGQVRRLSGQLIGLKSSSLARLPVPSPSNISNVPTVLNVPSFPGSSYGTVPITSKPTTKTETTGTTRKRSLHTISSSSHLESSASPQGPTMPSKPALTSNLTMISSQSNIQSTSIGNPSNGPGGMLQQPRMQNRPNMMRPPQSSSHFYLDRGINPVNMSPDRNISYVKQLQQHQQPPNIAQTGQIPQQTQNHQPQNINQCQPVINLHRQIMMSPQKLTPNTQGFQIRTPDLQQSHPMQQHRPVLIQPQNGFINPQQTPQYSQHQFSNSPQRTIATLQPNAHLQARKPPIPHASRQPNPQDIQNSQILPVQVSTVQGISSTYTKKESDNIPSQQAVPVSKGTFEIPSPGPQIPQMSQIVPAPGLRIPQNSLQFPILSESELLVWNHQKRFQHQSARFAISREEQAKQREEIRQHKIAQTRVKPAMEAKRERESLEMKNKRWVERQQDMVKHALANDGELPEHLTAMAVSMGAKSPATKDVPDLKTLSATPVPEPMQSVTISTSISSEQNVVEQAAADAHAAIAARNATTTPSNVEMSV